MQESPFNLGKNKLNNYTTFSLFFLSQIIRKAYNEIEENNH